MKLPPKIVNYLDQLTDEQSDMVLRAPVMRGKSLEKMEKRGNIYGPCLLGVAGESSKSVYRNATGTLYRVTEAFDGLCEKDGTAPPELIAAIKQHLGKRNPLPVQLSATEEVMS